MKEESRESYEVMAAQREEMKLREEKERKEMLEALMGGYQVEELLETAVKEAIKKKGADRRKGGGKGLGKPVFPQVGAGNRVTKKVGDGRVPNCDWRRAPAEVECCSVFCLLLLFLIHT